MVPIRNIEKMVSVSDLQAHPYLNWMDPKTKYSALSNRTTGKLYRLRRNNVVNSKCGAAEIAKRCVSNRQKRCSFRFAMQGSRNRESLSQLPRFPAQSGPLDQSGHDGSGVGETIPVRVTNVVTNRKPGHDAKFFSVT